MYQTDLQDLPAYFNYSQLLEKLNQYHSPRSKITRLLKQKKLLKIRRGLYITTAYFREETSRVLLANLLYGPSYISFEFALAHYSMIPEQVTTITSACFKRNKKYQTPAGVYHYYYIPSQVFPYGMSCESDGSSSYLIASEEKAICDMLARERSFKRMWELEEYLEKSLRLDMEVLNHMDLEFIRELSQLYKRRNVILFSKFLDSLHSRNRIIQ